MFMSQKNIDNDSIRDKFCNQFKIVHILNSLLPSGAETMLANSASLWFKCEKHIIATGKEIGNYADTLSQSGYIIHHIYTGHFISQHKEVIKLLKSLSPDVVHIHRESQECYYAMDAKCAGVPRLVRTVHNVFQFRGILRIRRIMTRAFGRVLGIKYVAIGQSVYNNEKHVFYNIPYCIIDNWCNESKYTFITEKKKIMSKKAAGISEKTMVLLTVGNCSSIKNHMLLIKAIKKLIYNNNADIIYYHVGKSNETWQEEEFVKKQHLEKYIKFLGYADPIDYMKMTDLYVMPSQYEGVGISALEAMFCGIPCLLTNVYGLKDFKQLESSSTYYSTLDESEFYQKLEDIYIYFKSGKLTNNYELSVLVRRKYSMKKSVQKYMKVYQGSFGGM